MTLAATWVARRKYPKRPKTQKIESKTENAENANNTPQCDNGSRS